MRRAKGLGACLGVLLTVTTLSGCGGTLYAITASSASSKLEQARAMGAEKYAPYEYYYAHEHLIKAQEEAATADYGDALDFAGTAEDYADKAIALSRDLARDGAQDGHEGAGR